MTDISIIFSSPMIRALLDGRKTQTRRVLKPQPNVLNGGKPLNNGYGSYSTDDGWKRYPYAPGDRLWSREAWSGNHVFRDTPPSQRSSFVGEGQPYLHDEIWYWADGSPGYGDWETPRPSIHMPRWASRLTLIITDVRVERLQEISENDIAAEGVERGYAEGTHGEEGLYEDFSALWNSIHGPDAWDANPWVAAMTFTVHKCNIDQMQDFE